MPLAEHAEVQWERAALFAPRAALPMLMAPLPRHFLDTSQTLPRHFLDTSQTLPRHFLIQALEVELAAVGAFHEPSKNLPRTFRRREWSSQRSERARAGCESSRELA